MWYKRQPNLPAGDQYGWSAGDQDDDKHKWLGTANFSLVLLFHFLLDIDLNNLSFPNFAKLFFTRQRPEFGAYTNQFPASGPNLNSQLILWCIYWNEFRRKWENLEKKNDARHLFNPKE